MKRKVYFSSIYTFILSATGLFCFALLLISSFLLTALDQGNSIENLLTIQTVVIWIIILMSVFSGVFTVVMLANPIRHMNEQLRAHKQLKLEGAAELQELAKNYNRMYAHLNKQSEKLSYEASHDALTGLYNRKVFDNIRNGDEMDEYALLLIDIDDFKEINDVYGHDTGDKILQKFAHILLDNFRSNDFCCRVGGDEFSVIMIKTGRSLQDLIENKLRTLNERLQDVSDGLPAASISCGVSFSSESEDPYVDADVALYQSKSRGTGHISFCEIKE